MWEVLDGLDGEYLIGLFAVAGGLFVVLVLGLTAFIVSAWQKHRGWELAAGIIQEMLDQGMPAEQIERVLKAAGFSERTAETPLERLLEYRNRRTAARSPAAANDE